MSRTIRFVIFAVGAVGVATLFAAAIHGVPAFGGAAHPYRDRAVAAALAHGTANVVSSVNFDQRGLDTLGEEVILLGSVLAASVLLRAAPGEHEHQPAAGQRVLPAVVLVGYLLLPVTLLVGLSVVAHGALTPGGGFQGGVVLATGLHLLYLAGSYRVLQQLRPAHWAAPVEAAGAGGFVVLGLAGLLAGAGFLGNALPSGTFGELLSAGTVPLYNIAVGAAVFGGVVMLLAQFLRQEEML